MIAPDDRVSRRNAGLQDRFDSRRLADRLVDKLSRTEFTDEDRAFVRAERCSSLQPLIATGGPTARTKAAQRGSCE